MANSLNALDKILDFHSSRIFLISYVIKGEQKDLCIVKKGIPGNRFNDSNVFLLTRVCRSKNYLSNRIEFIFAHP